MDGYIDLHEAISAGTAAVRWPEGYQLRQDGLWHEDARLTGPLTVLGLARDPQGHGWAIYLEWHDSDGRQHRGSVSKADLLGHGSDAFKPLVSAGLEIVGDPKRLKRLREGLAGLTCVARVRLVRHCGWAGEAFVLPHVTIPQQTGERFVFDGSSDAAHYAHGGTLQSWMDGVAAPAAGNSHLVFALCTAFAGPLNDLLEGEGGGVHLVGGSSTGKSTALVAAGSIWGGGGRAGFAQTWRATGNGLEGVARAHSGTVLVLDELGELDAREAGQTAYMLVNGQGKARATREAGVRPRAEWRVMLVSAGEVGLADKIAEGGKQPKAGQLVRLVDVPADAGRGYGLFEDTKGQSPASFAEAIKAAALAHYGHAGPMFVEALADDPAGVAAAARRLISERKQRLLAGLQAVDGQVERVAQRFALIATAGTLAQQCLHLPWADDEADRAAAICFRAWLTTRGEGPGELLAALQAIREAVEKHGEGRFRNLDREENGLDGFSQRAMRELLGYRRTRDGELLWCFTSAGLREVVGSLGQLASVVRMLAEREVLVTGSDRAHRLSLKVEGHTVQTYAVRQGALEAGGLP